MSTKHGYWMQTNLIKNDESLCIDNQQNSHCYKLQTANALITTNCKCPYNYKLQMPLYRYIKKAILTAILNKIPILSSF